MEEVKKFIDFLKMIIKKPGMFRINEVEDIYLVSFGYQCALDKDSPDEVGNFLLGFRSYVNTHFESNQNHDWSKLIQLYSGSKNHSIELFNNLFFQYLEVKGHVQNVT